MANFPFPKMSFLEDIQVIPLGWHPWLLTIWHRTVNSILKLPAARLWKKTTIKWSKTQFQLNRSITKNCAKIQYSVTETLWAAWMYYIIAIIGPVLSFNKDLGKQVKRGWRQQHTCSVGMRMLRTAQFFSGIVTERARPTVSLCDVLCQTKYSNDLQSFQEVDAYSFRLHFSPFLSSSSDYSPDYWRVSNQAIQQRKAINTPVSAWTQSGRMCFHILTEYTFQNMTAGKGEREESKKDGVRLLERGREGKRE